MSETGRQRPAQLIQVRCSSAVLLNTHKTHVRVAVNFWERQKNGKFSLKNDHSKTEHLSSYAEIHIMYVRESVNVRK